MASLREKRTSDYNAMSDAALRSMREHQLGWTANIRNAARLAESIAPATAPPRLAPATAAEAEYAALMQRLASERATALADTRRDYVTRAYRHEGVFEERTDPDGHARRMWSCCAASSLTARGCVVVTNDKHRWQYDE